MYAHKQSTVTFEVFFLWLRNKHYCTCDVIGIKMRCSDLPYYKNIRAKAHREYKLYEKITQTLYIPLENGPQLGTKSWLICHLMACTAIYSRGQNKVYICFLNPCNFVKAQWLLQLGGL